jgi:outer membrane receptor for ferrienterochelin and colicins
VLFHFLIQDHDQNSILWWYAIPHETACIGFGQLTWDKGINNHDLLFFGTALRYQYYDDNTTTQQ